MFRRKKKTPRKLRPKQCECGHDLVIVKDFIQQQGDESRLNPTPPGKCLCGRDIAYEYEHESGETDSLVSIGDERSEPPSDATDLMELAMGMVNPADSREAPTTRHRDDPNLAQQDVEEREAALARRELACDKDRQQLDHIKSVLEDERRKAEQLQEQLRKECALDHRRMADELKKVDRELQEERDRLHSEVREEKEQLEDDRKRAEQQLQGDLQRQRGQMHAEVREDKQQLEQDRERLHLDIVEIYNQLGQEREQARRERTELIRIRDQVEERNRELDRRTRTSPLNECLDDEQSAELAFPNEQSHARRRPTSRTRRQLLWQQVRK